MYEIITNIEITGSPQKVWSALIDFPSYPRWNPSIRSIVGTPAKDQKLKIAFKPQGSAWAMKFSVEIISCVLEKELRWKGCLLFPALFAGDHYFQIQALGQDRSMLIHGERFSGVLKSFIWNLLARRNEAAFIAMNRALKELVEDRSLIEG